MNKIKINLQKRKNITIKYNGQKIEITPYLDINDAITISYSCLDFLEKSIMDKEYEGITALDYLIDTKFLLYCTNIDFENLDVEDIISSDIIETIIPYIKNYNDIKQFILFNMKEKLLIEVFKKLGEQIPDVDKQAESLEKSKNIIKDMVDNGVLETVLNKTTDVLINDKVGDIKPVKKAKKNVK